MFNRDFNDLSGISNICRKRKTTLSNTIRWLKRGARVQLLIADNPIRHQ